MPASVDPWLRVHDVFHPTDCSPGAEAAFLHALRIAAAAGAQLSLMRIGAGEEAAQEEWLDARGTLQRWRTRTLAPLPDIAVRWLAVAGGDPVRACLRSLERSPAELIVVATRQADGRATWLGKSMAESLAHSSGEMTLLVPEGSAGFVCAEDGAITLKSILIPVASQPAPKAAVEAARRLMLYLPEARGTATLLHVGEPSGMPELQLPEFPGWTWNWVVRRGDVIDTILATASELVADLVAMTTQGRHGFLDALRGSTTQRVLCQTRRPMLTMPVGSFLG